MSVTNTAPTGLAPTGVFTIPNRMPGAVIGSFTATDPGDTLTYSVFNPRFVFFGSELRLAPGMDLFPFDGSTLSMAIRVTDAGGLFQQLTFTFAVVQTAFEWSYNVIVSGMQPDAFFGGITRVGTSMSDAISLNVAGLSEGGSGEATLAGVNLRLRQGTELDHVSLTALAEGGDGFGSAFPDIRGRAGLADIVDVAIVANDLTATLNATATGGDGSPGPFEASGGDGIAKIARLNLIADRSLNLELRAEALGGTASGTGFGGDASAGFSDATIRGGDGDDIVTLELTAQAFGGGFAGVGIDYTDIGLRGGNDELRITLNTRADDGLLTTIFGDFNVWAGNAGFDTLDFSGSLTTGVFLEVGNGPGGIGRGVFLEENPGLGFDPGLSFAFATFEAFIGTAQGDLFDDGIGAHSYGLGEADRLQRDPGRGADTIIASTRDSWQISLPGYGPGLDSYEELQARMRQVGDTVQISLGGGGSLTFVDALVSQLTPDRFTFSSFD
jgi:hypothetical protein